MKRGAVIIFEALWSIAQTAFAQSDESIPPYVHTLLLSEQTTYVEISGLVLTFSGLGTATTDTWGYYKKKGPEGWTGTATHWKTKHVFNPTSRNYAEVDSSFLGIRPDYVVTVHRDVLREKDGPMLRHGLQGLHNRRIFLPRKPELRPDPDLLALRWERFKEVA